MEKDALMEMAFQIISFAGDARRIAQEGIACAKKGDFEGAQAKLDEARKTIAEAHHLQTDMVSAEANGEELKFSVLLIHGQDHLMTAMVVVDLAEEFIDLYKHVEDKS